MTSLSGHQRPHRGASDVWLTPPEIIEALGPFDLDPCAAPEPRPWPTASTHLVEADDGLTLPWVGFVWLNSPFGPEVVHWVQKLADHGHGIALVAGRTDTAWWRQQIWERANGILFLHGRPYFYHPDGTRGRSNSGAPINLIGYGSEAVDRLKRSGLNGSLATGWDQVTQ